MKLANIGPRGQHQRLRFGLQALALGVVLGAVLILTGVPRPWRVTVALPLFVAALGYFQAHDKT
jgi:hypothetical protein